MGMLVLFFLLLALAPLAGEILKSLFEESAEHELSKRRRRRDKESRK
jgi:hypothetical protein